MFKHFMISAFRNFKKNKSFSLINIFNLSIGITAFTILFLYIRFEKSYDRFHENADFIYRVQANWFEDGKLVDQWAYIPPAIGPAMNEEFADVKNSCRIMPSKDYKISYRDFKASLKRVLFVEQSFLDMFTFLFTAGNSEQALDKPNTVILSQSAAAKIFGNENPINKTVEFFSKRGEMECLVTGVYKDIPQNSHLQSDYLISYKSLIPGYGERMETSWFFSRIFTFVQLNENSDPKQLQKQLPAFVKKHRSGVDDLELVLQPLKNIHLYSDISWDTDNGSIKVVYFMLSISLIILILVWINYINISTSSLFSRAKEVGIKKVIGGYKRQILIQFLIESVFYNLIALILSLYAILILLPYFNNLIGITLIDFHTDLNWFITFISILFIASILFSSLYPSIVFSSFGANAIIKSNISYSRKGDLIRQYLTFFQMVACILLIVCTIVVFKQVDYMMKKDLGINMKNMLILRAPTIEFSLDKQLYAQKMVAFKEKLKQYPFIENIASSYIVPGYEVPLTYVTRLGSERSVECSVNMVDYNFLDCYEIKFTAGRNFSPNFVSDKEAIIINEKMVELLGFKDAAQALNQKIKQDDQESEIIGIVKNFHQLSLKDTYLPFVFPFEEIGMYFYSIKINPENYNETLALVSEQWKHFFPRDALESFLLEDHYAAQYKIENLFSKLIGIFCILSLFIACLGLFALSYYSSKRKTKEIGIRKVVGASISNVFLMLTKEYTKWTLFANIISLPIAWYVMNKWLQNFAYRIDMSWWIFILAGASALVVALITVSWQAIRAATANPVEALKYE